MGSPEFPGERRAPNRDTFITITNLEIWEELVKLRTDFQAFALLRVEVSDHEKRVRELELASAKLWYVRPVSAGAVIAVLGDVIARLVHVL